MSGIADFFLRPGVFVGRPLIVLIAHIPILIFAIALVPALLLGFVISPARYAASVLKGLSQLQEWSCAVLVATGGVPLSQPPIVDPALNVAPAGTATPAADPGTQNAA